MYERWYGPRYHEVKDSREAAKAMRADIRAAVKAKQLPPDWRYSVRHRWATHTAAIDLVAISPRPIFAVDPASIDPYSWSNVLHPETGRRVATWRDAFTVEAADTRETLTQLCNAYQHDGSDIQVDYFDVRYLGNLTIETEATEIVSPAKAEEDEAWSEFLATEAEFWRAQAMLALGDDAA